MLTSFQAAVVAVPCEDERLRRRFPGNVHYRGTMEPFAYTFSVTEGGQVQCVIIEGMHPKVLSVMMVTLIVEHGTAVVCPPPPLLSNEAWHIRMCDAFSDKEVAAAAAMLSSIQTSYPALGSEGLELGLLWDKHAQGEEQAEAGDVMAMACDLRAALMHTKCAQLQGKLLGLPDNQENLGTALVALRMQLADLEVSLKGPPVQWVPASLLTLLATMKMEKRMGSGASYITKQMFMAKMTAWYQAFYMTECITEVS